MLFLLVIGDITQASIAKHHSVSKYSGIRWKMDRFLQHLDYADDICLLSYSALDAENMLYSLQNEAATFGLKTKSGKTKSISKLITKLNDDPVEEVNQFTYLGCEICKDGGSDAYVDCRVRQAKGALGILFREIVHS